MKDGLFEVGDIVRGIIGNRYFLTNERMTKAIIVEANKNNMRVKILEHGEDVQINREHYVENSTSKFELIEETKEEKDFWEDLEVL